MKTKRWFWVSQVIILIFFTLILSPTLASAQEEDLEGLDLEEQVKCEPESLTTVYDKYKSDSVDEQQLSIWYSLAREEYKYKNYKRAIPYYWKILVNDKTSKFKIVYSKLCDSYYHLNEPDSVLIVAYRGLKKYPNYTTLHYYAGSIHDRLGHIKCAIPHYEALTKANPKQKSYWEKLAFLYFQSEDPRAIEAQQKVVELDPNDVEASRLLADIMVHFGEDPLKALRQTFLKDTTNIENAMRYGKAAFEAGEYKEALKPFLAVVKRQPKNTLALEYIGRCYEGLNKNSTAIKYYKKILQIDPKNVKVMCLIGSVYSRLNEFVTARSYARRAMRIDPGNGLPHMIMAEIYENAIQYCSDKRKNKKFTYDDKVVYKLAQDEYRKAAKDPNYASDAKRRIQQLATLVPTKEDLFMHKNRLKPKEKCYQWINE